MWNCNNPYAYRDDNLRSIGFNSYREYCKSSLWQGIRARVIKRAGGRCERCSSTQCLQVHHRAYDPATLRGDTIDALTLVCRRCHCKAEQPNRSRHRHERLMAASELIMESEPSPAERLTTWYRQYRDFLPKCVTLADVAGLVLGIRDRATRVDVISGTRCLLCGTDIRKAREPKQLSTGYTICREHSWSAYRATCRALKLTLPDSFDLAGTVVQYPNS